MRVSDIISEVSYLFKCNAQNCIPKTPTQSSVRVINEVLDFYARGHKSSDAHNKQVICKRTCKYGIVRMACFNIAQRCKNPVAHSHCVIKNLVKKEL